MYTVPKREFIETLEEKIIKPRGLDYKIQFCGPTGTNAVEAAIKLARKNTGRSNIFAFMGCFHGMTLGALSLTSEMYARNGAGASLNDVTHIPAPYMFEGLDVIEYMQTLIDDDHSAVSKPAAVIMETLQAEGGIRPFTDEFLRDVREFCDRNGILMIVDDIQVGCCRCGTFFSFERAGIKPDMVVMSKSIGGMGMPLAIVLLKEELDKWKPGEHNGTFRGNQLSFIAGKASFEQPPRAARNGSYLGYRLRQDQPRIKRADHREVLRAEPHLRVRGQKRRCPQDHASARNRRRAADEGS